MCDAQKRQPFRLGPREGKKTHFPVYRGAGVKQTLPKFVQVKGMIGRQPASSLERSLPSQASRRGIVVECVSDPAKPVFPKVRNRSI